MKATTTTKRRRGQVADSYLALVKRVPIRRIRSDAEHAAAMKVSRELMLRGTVDRLDEGEGDYLEALSRFIEEYERTRFLRDFKAPTAVDKLKFLMEQRDMSAADLGRVLGSSSAASMILRGDREISKAHIRRLSEHFSVSPALFL